MLQFLGRSRWRAPALALMAALILPAPGPAQEKEPNLSAEQTLSETKALHGAGRFQAALGPLETYLTQDPRNTVVRLEYARTLAILRRFTEARREYRRVLDSEPQNAAALVGVAKVASWQGQNQLALGTYNRVLAQQPALYDALVGKGFLLLWMGQREEARALFQQAQQQHPEDAEVREALNSLGQKPAAEAPPAEKPAEEAEVPAPPEASVPATEKEAAPAPARREKPRMTPLRKEQPVREAAQRGALPARAPVHPSPLLMQAATLLILTAGGMLAYRTRRQRRAASGPLPVSRVRFELPASPLAAQPEEAAARSESILGGRVLVVHPEEEVLDFTRKVLAGAGAEVLALSRGEDALVRLGKGQYDAVILNETISGGWTGMEIYRWMQQKNPGSEKKVMLAVSDMSDPERRQFVDDTGVLCITTPFGVSDLIAMTRLLQQKARATTAVN